MKYCILILFVFFSCSKQKNAEPVAEIQQEEIPKIIDEKQILMGSLKLDLNSNGNTADKVAVYQLKKEYDKDSIGTLYYKILFFKSEKLVYEHRGTIMVAETGDWTIDDQFMNEEKQQMPDRHFIYISNGYPACGYTHTHLLFHLDENKIALVKEWKTMSDGGYGIHTQFFPEFQDGKVSSFSTVDVVVDEAPMLADSIERIEVRYQDSVKYMWMDKKWVKTALTPKEKAYRKQQHTFEEYYEIE